MSTSAIAFALADRYPWAGRAMLSIGNSLSRSNQPHWALLELSRRLNRHLTRKYTLANGRVLHCDRNDILSGEIAICGYYEPETVALMTSLIRRGGVAADVGAYVGHHAIVVADHVGPTGHVHTFEPDPVTFSLLRRNVNANKLRNVTYVHTAVGDKEGEVPLYLASITSAPANSLGRTVHTSGRHVNVKLLSLDHYFGVNPISRLDLMKVDVEGAELMVLEGAAKTLDRFRPNLILEFSSHTEAFGYKSDKIVEWLRARSYRLFRVGPLPLEPYVSQPDETLFYNVCAVHADRLPALAAAGAVRP